MRRSILYTAVLAVAAFSVPANARPAPASDDSPSDSAVNSAFYTEGAKHGSSVYKIVDTLFDGYEKSTVVYDRIAEMTDLYGHRITGSVTNEQSLDWLITTASKVDGFEVRTEPVVANKWVRNQESLHLEGLPRGNISLAMLGLGNSIGTNGTDIVGEPVVVHNKEEFDKLPDDAIKGKIVVWNVPFIKSYDEVFEYRSKGPTWAASRGAVASLFRSATPFSHSVPHTGSSVRTTIPGAAIIAEDANLIERLVKRAALKNDTETRAKYPFRDSFVVPKLRLNMGAEYAANGTNTRNVIFELKGKEKPNEIVLLGGHIDSWDVGTGSMDDAGGIFVSWEALRLIKTKLGGKQPKRTIRVVAFNNEEAGQRGAIAYAASSNRTGEKHIFAAESDTGVFNPWGLYIAAKDKAYGFLSGLGKRLLGTRDVGHTFRIPENEEADIDPLCIQYNGTLPCAGVKSRDVITNEPPTNSNKTLGTNGYFWFHHTAADRLEVLNSTYLSKQASALAVWAYAIAESPDGALQG
ncbi:Zn-dependent exopeptidase [Ramicandelaber brevisporus]|nr:Zn-dependent exopeptidase [Ramicandelaber brevisporus]